MVHFKNIPFLGSSMYYNFSLLYTIYNLASEYNFNCGFKFFFDFSDVVYTLVVYITYNMGKRDLPDTRICPRPRARAYISGKSLLPML